MGNPNIGLRPLPDAKGQIVTRKYPVYASNALPLGIGSPVMVADGEAEATAAATDTLAQYMTGAVVRCIGPNGNTVQNIPASTAGYEVEISVGEQQTYAVLCDEEIDFTKTYDLTTETMTANSNGFDGDAFSKRKMGVVTTGGGLLKPLALTGAIGNTNDNGGEMVVMINSACYTAG